MGGNTGNIRSRSPSSCNGYKTFVSILAGDSMSGAGSVKRMYAYYVKNNKTPPEIYKAVFALNYGQYKDRTQWFLRTIS